MKLLPYQGVVSINGSKSIIQRIFLIASVQKVRTKLQPGSVCDDVLEMAEALRALGVQISFENDGIMIDSSCLETNQGSSVEVRFKASATALRFWLARTISVHDKSTILLSGQLYSRPLQPYLDILKAIGGIVVISETENSEFPIQIEITPPTLVPSEIAVDSSISSQFISGLMLIAPFLEKGLSIIFNQKPVSRDYLELTAQLMQQYNIKCSLWEDRALIAGRSEYLIADKQIIETDISGAAFFLVLGSFSKQGIGIRNYTNTRWQPDWRILTILRKMGVVITEKDDVVTSKKGTLTGIDIDMDNNTDLVPVLAVLALFADSPSVLRNISRLKYKESDRIKGLLYAYNTICADYFYESGCLTINPLLQNVKAVTLDTQNDHRLVMAFSLLQLHFPNISLTETQTINKSFPEFFLLLAALSG